MPAASAVYALGILQAKKRPGACVYWVVRRSRLTDRLQRDPLVREVVEVWRANGVKPSSVAAYLWWVAKFQEDCKRRRRDVTDALEATEVRALAQRLARRTGRDMDGAVRSARSALRALHWGLAALGHAVRPWSRERAGPARASALVEEFLAHRRAHRGLSSRTLDRDRFWTERLIVFLRRQKLTLEQLSVDDVDAFVLRWRERLAPKTVATACTTVRALLRFLYATGRIASDLGTSVVAPVVRRRDRPPRALPWPDVRRILRAIDRSTPVGRRDYALLLLMAACGLGAAEATHLRLDDVDWRARRLRVVRPKTGQFIELPLLPSVGRALAAYLRRGRPQYTTSRTLFVQTRAPFGAFTAASAVSHILRKHAHAAGVVAPSLCSHVLRHSHATRHVEIGTHPRVVGDILGHRDPQSMSSYVRIAFSRLRAVSLPVPR